MSLSGEAAYALSKNQLEAVKSDLINYSVQQNLLDSGGNLLLDSTNGTILGRTLFPDAKRVIDLQKDISDLTSLVNSIAALLFSNTTTTEHWISGANKEIQAINDEITKISEHALLDSDYI